MIIRVLRDGHQFFDRHWTTIVAAAVCSIGGIGALSFALRSVVALPSLNITTIAPEASALGLTYYDLIETVALFIASIWFQTFIATLVFGELHTSAPGASETFKRSLAAYPRVMMANAISALLVYMSLFFVLFGSVFTAAGILTAITFYIWLSLVTPVVVIDQDLPSRRIMNVLRRSRVLVRGYFWQVLSIHLIAFSPALAVLGVPEKSIYFWPSIIFVNVITGIFEAVLVTFAYINLRITKGERLTGISPVEASDET